MKTLKQCVERRATHRGPHARSQVNRQRRTALILIITGLFRVFCWLTLMGTYVLHLIFPSVFVFTSVLFHSVPFVAMISLYANAATDWGQVAASLAQLTAGDAHQDAEHNRAIFHANLDDISASIDRLAILTGEEARLLAEETKQALYNASPAISN